MIIRQETPSGYKTVYTPLSILPAYQKQKISLALIKEDHTSFIVTIVA